MGPGPFDRALLVYKDRNSDSAKVQHGGPGKCIDVNNLTSIPSKIDNFVKCGIKVEIITN